MQKLVLIFLLLLPNCVQAQEFENVLWWKAMDNESGVDDVAISPDGKYFLSLTEKLQLWDANNGDFILDFELDNYLVNADIFFSNDSKYVYANREMKEGDFAIWEVATGKIYRRFVTQYEIYDASMSSDGQRIAVTDNHEIISVYNIETKELIASRKVNEYIQGGISYSPDDKYIVYGWSTNKGEEHGIFWLDANTLETHEYMPQHAHEDITSDVAFSRDGEYMLLYTGANSYGEIPTAIYNYPELKDVSFFVDRDTLQCSNYYLSPKTNELIVDGQTYASSYRHFYIFPKKDGKIKDNNILPYIPFLFLRDTDTSGKKMPGFRARVASIHTKDTMGVFLPPWNTSKVKEKTNNNEDKIYPNPSTNSADIAFALDDAEEIKIMIYDNSGRLVETLHSGLLEAGEHTFSWNSSNVSSGKYICNIRGNSVFKSLQLVVAR